MGGWVGVTEATAGGGGTSNGEGCYFSNIISTQRKKTEHS